MSRYFTKTLASLEPYTPGEQLKIADIVKLNANENPYPPAPGVTEVLRTFDAAKLAVYPDANAKALKTVLAEREGLKPSQVFLGNGSDDVLALAFQSFFCSGEPILYPDITYSFYPVSQGSTCLVVLWIPPCQLVFRLRGFHPLWPAFPKPFC